MKPLLTLLFLMFSLIAAAQGDRETPQEKRIVNLIARLPEIASFNKQMLKKLKRPLVITVDHDPTPTNPNYRIAIAENFGNRVFTYWRFLVNGKTHAIYYYHTIEDTSETLAAWRRHNYKWSGYP